MSLERATSLGLVLRGAFRPTRDDDVAGDAALLLFGNAGSSIWPTFSDSPEFRDGEADPLNRWSERVGHLLAAEWNGTALFPFGGPPYQPFLRWAAKAEGLRSSELGLLMHPEFGLWHAYRFAISLPEWPEWLAETPTPSSEHACDRCAAKPCLVACPVEAFSKNGYDVERCFRYLDDNPDAACHSAGCLARAACPEGEAYRYQPDHAAFHMEKFYASLVDRFASSP